MQLRVGSDQIQDILPTFTLCDIVSSVECATADIRRLVSRAELGQVCKALIDRRSSNFSVVYCGRATVDACTGYLSMREDRPVLTSGE